ncbi:EamA family transporter [Novosphingobium sp. ZN18A2]|uniref:DMT family transporter n=1 Tax=Novosphingobium sp. ZN18A2 TaxID=3079861 RepID=UPI0030CF0D6A
MTAPSAPTAPTAVSFWHARTVVPFMLVALIWGSTWLVIKDQVGTVPPSWSVTWRFMLAACGMFALAAVRRDPLWLGARGLRVAMAVGIPLFALNFQFVYRAEQHLTSGIVAVMFALLLVPNALLARTFLGQPVTRRFLGGSAVAIAGIALLLWHEFRDAPPEGGIALGIVFTLVGIGCASVSNVVQATGPARDYPMTTLLAWAMAFGALADVAIAWMLAGPPQVEWRAGYFAGIAYLALVGSVLTFPLYFGLVRTLGAGRAAYNGVLVPVVAMLLSTLFEGYRWTPIAASGAALALVGLVLALKARNPAK